AVATVGAGAWREPGGSGGGERAPAAAQNVQQPAESQASGAAAVAGGFAARGESDPLHAGTMHVQSLRSRDGSDRLRAERAIGCAQPARYFVLVTKREKRACNCQAGGITAAPLPARIIDKSLVSDRVVIDTVVAKYSDYLPLYRQSAILERETGLEISRATLDGWVMRVGELLIPIAAAMRQELLAGSYIQADETPVDVQTHD